MNDYRSHKNEHIRRQVLEQLGEGAGANKPPTKKKREPTWDPALTAQVMESFGLPAPTLEHQFHQTRKWRFDFAWPDHRVYMEVEGGIYEHGGHTSITGIKRDIAKYNAAALAGWVGLRVLPEQLPGKRGLSIEAYVLDGVKTLLELPDRSRFKEG